MKTLIVIPTYNEAANIIGMLDALRKLAVPALRVLVVDDNSPDGTGQLVEDYKLLYQDFVSVLHRKEKTGLGGAYVAGFTEALKSDADQIVQMDADFSHSPDYIPGMLAKLADYDVVIGSRYVGDGELDETWSWWRVFLSWFANQVTQKVLGITVKDTTAGFKAWRRATLQGVNVQRVKSNSYAFQVEMACLTERLGYTPVEVPIYFQDREEGESKVDVNTIMASAMQVFQIANRWRRITPADRATS